MVTGRINDIEAAAKHGNGPACSIQGPEMRTGIESHSQPAGDCKPATGKIPGKLARITPAIRGRVAAAYDADLCGIEDINIALNEQYEWRIVDLAKQAGISVICPGKQVSIRARQPFEVGVYPAPIQVLQGVDCILAQSECSECRGFSGKDGV